MNNRYLFLLPVALAAESPSSFEVAAHQAPQTVCPADPKATSWFEMRSTLAPSVDDPFYVHGTLLYWTLSRRSSAYGMDKDYQVPGTGETPFTSSGAAAGPQGTLQSYSWGWNPGVRVASGYAFSGTPWFVEGDWSQLFAKKDDSYTLGVGPFTFLNPAWGGGYINATTGLPSAVEWVTRFHYNQAALLFGLGWSPVDSLLMNFKFGPSALFLIDDLKVTWLGSAAESFERTIWDRSLHFSGGGLSMNGTAVFAFGKGLSLASKGLLGAYYGNYVYDLSVNIPQQPTQGEINLSDIKTHGLRTAVFQAGVGAELGWEFLVRSFDFQLALGYEAMVLSNFYQDYINQSLTTNVGAALANQVSDEIFLHGLTARIGFGF